MKYFLILMTFILASFTITSAQVISINAANEDFKVFINRLQETTGYTFFYNEKDFNSIIVDGSFDKMALESVLAQILADQGLEYSIDHTDRNVFITKGVKILTKLPEGFFENHLQQRKQTSQEVVIFDYFDEKLKMSDEEKLYEIGTKSNVIRSGNATLEGRIKHSESGELIIGATVIAQNASTGTATDLSGAFSLSMPKGRHTLKISAIGFREVTREIILYSDGHMDVELQEQVMSLKEVVVRSERDVNVSGAQMGVEKMTIQTIKQIPMAMGEPDILRVMVTLPGVKTVGEASTGFNVRGGSVDQNLILFNDATVYNPSHLFGFFSAFNSDLISEVELFKSAIPSRYGGRLASVLDIKPRYGNKKKISGSAGIGILTSRLMVEGPLAGEKTSFIAGVRATYSNWALNLLKNSEYKNSEATFYDGSLGLTHEIDKNNYLYMTGYLSKDGFRLRSDTTFQYQNQNIVFKWKRITNDKMFAVYTGAFSKYKYNISAEENPVNAFKLGFDIQQVNLKADYNFTLNENHQLSFGGGTILYNLQLGSLSPLGAESQIGRTILPSEQAFETSFYLEDNFEVSKKLLLNMGVRYSRFDYLGPKDVYTYAPGEPRNNDNRIDTIAFNSGEHIQSYHGPEIRVSARYILARDFSIKAGFNTLRQYIHMLSNSTAVSPTDIWKLSDNNIRPQLGRQVSLGLYKNFNSGGIEASVETYLKNMENFLDYKGGAELILNPAIETDVINTKGEAYGIELLLKKKTGKLTGWFSYTYSRILLKVDDPFAGETINNGEWYPANYDKPHDATLITNYKFSHRFNIGVNCTYNTGRPITLPIGRFSYSGAERVLYSDRNKYRIPDYFRLDFAMNIEGNHKVHQKTHNSWTVGVYNLTGRRNVYSAYFVTENKSINGYRLSIFGSFIPYINFNIRF